MRRWLYVVFACLLIACGGGGGSTTPSSGTVSDNTDTTTTPDPNTVDTGGSTGTDTGSVDPDFTLLAWNDLGMHCMDSDYSVFSILPPYNVLHAQLVSKTTGIVTSNITLTYESYRDPQGSINTTSEGKTNFWNYVEPLYGATPAVDTGLTGNTTPRLGPAPLDISAANQEFVADGIPITPYDDNLDKNFYPMVTVAARNSAGDLLATARVVLPVSDEMSCHSCHASRQSGSSAQLAAMPTAGWVFDADPERDYRLNILQIHDEKQAGDSRFASALGTLGYSGTGLFDTAASGTPVLCAACHATNALPGTGIDGISSLTSAMHAMHANVIDPSNALSMDDSDNRSACYQCHPGSETKCLRGAMGAAVDGNGNFTMQCQSCHGAMSIVGDPGRKGWLDEPNCQSCHHDGLRALSTLNAQGRPKTWGEVADKRFATNPDTPVAGTSLYRMSKGHGDLQCEACHGATHAIYPSSHDNDNLLALDIQGHTGTIAQCSACHNDVPWTKTGGPHGMHTTGLRWANDHSETFDNPAECQACHGADYRGTPLSALKTDVSWSVHEFGTKNFAAGHQISCYDCHNGPDYDD